MEKEQIRPNIRRRKQILSYQKCYQRKSVKPRFDSWRNKTEIPSHITKKRKNINKIATERREITTELILTFSNCL